MIRILNENDRKKVVDYLERNHIECTFLIGNVENFGIENDREKRRCADYFGYFDGNELKGILSFYNLGSCIPHFESLGAVPEFVEIMRDRKFKFLLGMSKLVNPLYEGIKDGKVLREHSDDSYFVNEKPVPFVLPDIEIKDWKMLKLDDVLDFMVEARKNGFGEEQSKEEAKRTLTQRADDENYIFLVKDGKIASQACIQTSTSKINQVGGVYTSESERGRGYCKAVVSELCRIITERGKTPTLMVRKNNTPAVRAYTSLGFKHYDDYNLISFKD